MGDLRPPRFPYVGALLCAACLGAARWTWMRYSYCWDVTPEELSPLLMTHLSEYDTTLCLGGMVRLRGVSHSAAVADLSEGGGRQC